MKRGPDLDIEAIFNDLESDRPSSGLDDTFDEDPEVEHPADVDARYEDGEEELFSEEEWPRG